MGSSCSSRTGWREVSCARRCARSGTSNGWSTGPSPARSGRASWRRCAPLCCWFRICVRSCGLVPGTETLPDVSDIASMLERAITEDPPAVLGRGESIRPGISPELDGHRVRAREAREWIAGLERTERERTGIRTLKTGYNKVFGYYLEITAAALATRPNATARRRVRPARRLPDDYIPKQSLANATRYFTPQLKEYETIVLTARGDAGEHRGGCLSPGDRRSRGSVGPACSTRPAIVAQLDVLARLADVAIERQYVRPALNEADAHRDRARAVTRPSKPCSGRANSCRTMPCSMPTADQIIILTGPNMAGKST